MLNTTNYQENTNQNYSELSPHTNQNDHHHEVHKQHMQSRMWRKGKPPKLLVGM